MVMRALADPHPGMRENALLLAETLLPGSTRLQQRLIATVGDPAARVRFQAALTLGQIDHRDAPAALHRIFLTDVEHRWSRVAVLSSLRRDEDRFLETLLGDGLFSKTNSDRRCKSN